MAKWKKNDVLVNNLDKSKIIIILDSNNENYLFSIYPTSLRIIGNLKNLDKEFSLIKQGTKNGKSNKNPSGNNRGSKSKIRKTKTSSTLPKSSNNTTNRKKSKTTTTSSGSNTSSSSKPRVRNWWKKRKKSVRSKDGLKHPNKGI